MTNPTKLLTGLARAALVCAILLLAARASAQTNWPSFRGPFASGLAIESETPANWNVEKEQNVCWSAPVPGLGHSSPVIWGDRVFVTTAINEKTRAPLKVGLYGDPESAQDNDPQKWEVYCLAKISGSPLWHATAHEGRPKVPRHP